MPPHTPHDWWNAGDETAHVRVEIRPAARFEEMVTTLFRLAQDGKTDAKGRPHLLQLALFAREYDDVLRLTRPPRFVQKTLFAVLAPVARLLGYQGSYPEYRARPQPGSALESAPKDLVPEKVG